MDHAIEMVGQFLLAKAEFLPLANWPKQQVGQWILHWHPRLPVREVRSQAGTHVGWIIGLVVDGERGVLPPVWRLPFDCNEADTEIRFESELCRLGGRFAAVFLTTRSQRFYLDASGSLAAVYCEDRQVVASSCNLIPHNEDLKKNVDLVRSFGFPSRDGYFPFGLTPWFRITRLLPNHYLDLRSWTAVRHWPNGSWTGSSEHTEKAVESIAALIEAYISGVAKQAPLQVPLTAGRDSRMLLACSRPSLSRIRFYTDAIPDFSGRMDCSYGRRIARRLGLEYSVRSWRGASNEEIEGWLYRTGYCVMDRITRGTRTDQQSDPTRITLLGIAGEVGRWTSWTPEDRADDHLSPDRLFERFHFPMVDDVVRAASDWLNELPTANFLEKLDLFYIEQRMGCWAGPSMYGNVNSAFVTYAFNSRQIYDEMLSLPVEYRRLRRLYADVAYLKWPELLEFPFNEPDRLLWFEHQVKRRLAVAKKAIQNLFR